MALLLAAAPASARADAQAPQAYLDLNGTTDYVQVDASDTGDFSVSSAGLTVSAWLRPDTWQLPSAQGTTGCKYSHWLGKGEGDQQEWAFRIYQDDATACSGSPSNRSKRISFYVFNPSAPSGQTNRGCGSYFQDSVQAGEWVHVVGTIDSCLQTVTIYKNGQKRHTHSYAGIIDPQAGMSPVRLGTRDRASYLPGALAEVRVWSRPLSDQEVSDLYSQDLAQQDGLVAEYLLNDGGGSTAHDTAGTHDGTVNGSPSWGGPDGGSINGDNVQSGGGC